MKTQKGLVSILTPAYNASQYIHRLLESVLMQDYPEIEMIVIDDGSTDNTKQLIESYIPKFQEKGYLLTCIYQENAGQAAAINRGLKLVKGQYLCWPDSDDFYATSISISKFVDALNNVDDSYAIVRSIGNFLKEDTFELTYKGLRFTTAEHQFEHSLLGLGFLNVPINYMVKMEAFDKVNPSRSIFTGRHPQNAQLFEPLLYSYKVKCIESGLCNVLVRRNSHSHKYKGYEKTNDDIEGYIEIQLNTLDSIKEMSDSKRMEYKKRVLSYLYNEKLALSLRYYKKDDAKQIVIYLRQNGLEPDKGKMLRLRLLSINPYLLRFISAFHVFLKKIKNHIK